MRGHPDDADVLPRPATDLGPLWRQAPASTGTEQRTLAEERFHAWLATPDGTVAMEWIEQRAVRRYDAGERRIGAKELTEACRKALRVRINNSWTSVLARRLVDRHPELRDVIELRQRSG